MKLILAILMVTISSCSILLTEEDYIFREDRAANFIECSQWARERHGKQSVSLNALTDRCMGARGHLLK
jgi:hypothetical protein